jgi:hypothetical protein
MKWHSENVTLLGWTITVTSAAILGVGKSGPGGVFKDLANTFSSLGGALNVAGGADALADFLALCNRLVGGQDCQTGYHSLARERPASDWSCEVPQ